MGGMGLKGGGLVGGEGIWMEKEEGEEKEEDKGITGVGMLRVKAKMRSLKWFLEEHKFYKESKIETEIT